VTTNGSGVSSLVLDTSTKQLTYKLTIQNVTGITQAHIHAGAAGTNGGVVLTLCGAPPNTPPNPAPPPCNFTPSTPSLTGTLTLNDAQIDALTTNGYYINAHTPANPGGEIRGQIHPFAAPHTFLATLLGSNEVPPVTTNANGAASLELDNTQTQLTYLVAVSNISNITASHIHRGAAGANGGIIHPLPFAAGAFAPGSPIAGTIDLTPEDLNDLLLGDFYINVHTTTNPGGEIRGQILEAVTRSFLPVIRQ